MVDEFDHGSRVIARFKPRNLDTLRGCMFRLIGRVFTYEWSGASMEDEPYPGQHRWINIRECDHEMPIECRARWVPHEDLEIIEVVK